MVVTPVVAAISIPMTALIRVLDRLVILDPRATQADQAAQITQADRMVQTMSMPMSIRRPSFALPATMSTLMMERES